MKFVDTPVLRVGHEEWNPGAAKTVLLHGRPDSTRRGSTVARELIAFLGDPLGAGR